MIKIVGPCADFPALGDIGWFHDHNQGGPDPTTEAACNTRRDAWRTACGLLRETEITNCFGTQYTCPLSTSSFPPSRKCGTRYVGAYMKEKNTLEKDKSKLERHLVDAQRRQKKAQSAVSSINAANMALREQIVEMENRLNESKRAHHNLLNTLNDL